MIKIIFGLRKLKRIGLPFKTDEEQVLVGGCQVFGFRHITFEMPVRYPSNVVQCEVGYILLEFRQ